MRLLPKWPGSFLRLVWIGFACVAIPLLVAVVHSGILAGSLARQGSEAVQKAARAASDGRQLVDQIVSLERRARQLYVLGEGQLFEDYSLRRLELRDTVLRLDRLLDDSAQKTRLTELARLEEAVFHILSTGPYREGADVAAFDGFVRLNTLARQVMTESSQLAIEEADRLRQRAARAQRVLVWEVSALLPVTVLITALFAGLLTRPIRRIDQSIRRLGAGKFTGRIDVRGPRDLQLLGERLDWLRRRLAGLEAEKAKFLAHISHELKTPLTSIREGTEILDEEVVGPLTPEQREVAGILKDSTLRLQRLIENLLDFSMKRARRVGSTAPSADFDGVLGAIVTDHKTAVMSKELRLGVPPATGFRVQVEPEELRTILDNLLGNAVKFTPPGGSIELAARGAETALVFEIADSGPGIPPAERERIFEPFYQGSAPGDGAVRGSGLGLSIVAERLAEVGGDIEVDESVAGGTLFRLHLPLAVDERKQTE